MLNHVSVIPEQVVEVKPMTKDSMGNKCIEQNMQNKTDHHVTCEDVKKANLKQQKN